MSSKSEEPTTVADVIRGIVMMATVFSVSAYWTDCGLV
jgi:hypothetical protein